MTEQELYDWKELADSYLEFDFSIFDNIKNTVSEGWSDPLKAYLVLKRIEDMAKQTKENILSAAVREADMYDKGKEIDGYRISKINSPGRWDFSKIKSWSDKRSELKNIEEKYKSAYKNWENGVTSVDEETGEQIEIPVYTPGKDTIKVTPLK